MIILFEVFCPFSKQVQLVHPDAVKFWFAEEKSYDLLKIHFFPMYTRIYYGINTSIDDEEAQKLLRKKVATYSLVED